MVAAALAAGWMGASIAQGPSAEQSTGASSGPRALGTAPILRAENLRQRLAEPPLPSRGRNPFVFGARPSARPTGLRDRSDARAEMPETPVYEPPPPAQPVFKLSGIASNAEGDTTVLTAIVNDNGAMVFVKAGDKLSNGYSVVRVEETSVTLVDATGITQTIRLP
jgi:hypothetical protein